MAKLKKAQVGKLVNKYKNWTRKIEDEKQYSRKSFKTADSLRSATPKSKDLAGKLKESKSNRAKADSIEKAVEKRIGVPRKYNLYEQKNGGKTVKKKMQAGGVAGKQPNAGMVDPKGAYTKVQMRTLGNMKKGGKMKKAFLGQLMGAFKNPGETSILGAAKKGSGIFDGGIMGALKRRKKSATPAAGMQPTTPTGTMRKGGAIKAKGGKWIQKAIKKPGALRAQLGAKPGKPIPAGKLAKAAKAKGKLGQRARLAQTLKKMKKK